MQSGKGRKSFAAAIFLLAATFVSFAPAAVEASNPTKPEIPLGEETFEPAPANKASDKATTPPEQQNTKDSTGSSANSSINDTNKTEEKDVQAEAAQPTKTPTLLEGKVPPATPTKGSGFIWFGVIFVLLAIAIFIFT